MDDEREYNAARQAARRGAGTRREQEPPAPAPGWRPPASANPWARAFDGDTLPDEPYMGSNKRPRQANDMIPPPDAASPPEEPAAPAARTMGI